MYLGPENANSTEFSGFHGFRGASKAERHGSFEVFYQAADEETVDWEPGWYRWACYPGCLPDGEPSGPFDTAKQAWENANDQG